MSLKPLFTPSLCLVFAFLLSMTGYSQDSVWKTCTITEDLTVSMPGILYVVDSPKLKVTATHFNGCGFQANYTKTKFEAKSGYDLIRLYDGFVKGYLNAKNVKQYQSTVTDTSFDGTTGKWIKSVYSKDTVYQERNTYIVLVNSHFYNIVFFSHKAKDPHADSLLSRFCASISFPHKPIKEYSEEFRQQVKNYKTGTAVGRYGVFTLFFGGAIVLGLVLRRKMR